MKIDIISRYTGKTIVSGKYKNIKDAVERNRYNLAGADLAGADLTGANLTGADLERADLYGSNLSKSNLTGADLSKANLSESNLSKANLTGADLSKANLFGADLSESFLSRSNLFGAKLYGADLSKSNLSGYMYIKGSKHDFQFFGNNIKIGCHYFSKEYWKIMYDTIGREEGYTEEQIKEYYRYIKFCDSLEEIK